MKIIYIAGPYRSNTEYGLKRNIDLAEKRAIVVWQNGGAALCPHKNSAYLGGVTPDNNFLIGGLELLTRSDAVYVGGDYKNSQGTMAEIALAKQLGMPVLWNKDQVELYLNGTMDLECMPTNEDYNQLVDSTKAEDTGQPVVYEDAKEWGFTQNEELSTISTL